MTLDHDLIDHSVRRTRTTPPGTSPRTAPSRGPTGSSPSSRPSTPSSASSRPARRPTSTSWPRPCPAAARRCWRPSGTARPSTGMFHRDAGYTEGRRVKKSRERRALARRTEFGRELAAGQWAGAEFAALATLWELGAPVPYPVQLYGTELMLEFIGTPDGDGRAATGADPPGAGRAGRPVRAVRRRDAAAGPRRLRPRRPVAVQPARASDGRLVHDRPAADRRPGREPAGPGLPAPRLRERVHVVRAPRAAPPSSSSSCSAT